MRLLFIVYLSCTLFIMVTLNILSHLTIKTISYIAVMSVVVILTFFSARYLFDFNIAIWLSMPSHNLPLIALVMAITVVYIIWIRIGEKKNERSFFWKQAPSQKTFVYACLRLLDDNGWVCLKTMSSHAVHISRMQRNDISISFIIFAGKVDIDHAYRVMKFAKSNIWGKVVIVTWAPVPNHLEESLMKNGWSFVYANTPQALEKYC